MENKELYTKVQETIMEVSLAKSALHQLQGSDEETASLIDFAIERLESAKRIEMDLAIEVVNMDLSEIELADTFPNQFVGEVDKWRNFIDLPRMYSRLLKIWVCSWSFLICCPISMLSLSALEECV